MESSDCLQEEQIIPQRSERVLSALIVRCLFEMDIYIKSGLNSVGKSHQSLVTEARKKL